MKKLIIAATALVLATPAIASKARLEALGDSKDGSFFIQDFRNIFLNSAHVNNHKDQVFVEYGDAGNGLSIDTEDDQKAAGGFLMSSGNLVYGVYLGNESDTDALVRATAWNANQLSEVDNVTDFFIGGEAAGMQWGANLVYSKNEDEAAKREDDRMAIRLGMIRGDLEAFANISLGNEATDTDAGTTAGTELKFDGKLGYHIGGSYQINNWRPYVSYKTGKWDAIDGTTTTEGTFTEIIVGVGHTQEISKSSRLYTRVNYFSEEAEMKFAASPTSAKISMVPVTFGYEVDATDWLTLRGSVSSNLMGKRETKNITSIVNAQAEALFKARYNRNGADTADRDETIQDGTAVNAGATLRFGRVSIDGLIGLSGNNGDASDAVAGVDDDRRGVLALDRLMTRVAMIYSF